MIELMVSGATIRDTLIGVLRPLLKTQTPDKTTEPTKAHGLLLIQRKGKDSKEARRAAHSHPPRAGGQSPPRSRVPLERVANLRLARGSLSGPLANLRLARE